MADNRKIVIEIVDKTDNTEISQLSSKLDIDPQKIKREKAAKQKNEFQHLTSVLLNQAWQQARSLAVNALNSTANRYFNLKEDYMNENLYNNIKQTYQISSSIINSTIGGAITGATVGGGVGGAIGAGIGLVSSSISEGINAYNKISTVYSKLQTSNYNAVFNQTRAGLTNGSKGTEN